MKINLKMVFFLLLPAVVLIAAPDTKQVGIKLFLSRPVDAGPDAGNRNAWFGAVLDAQVRFRLEPVPEVNAPDFVSVIRQYPVMAAKTTPAEIEMAGIAEKLGCTHILFHSYEFINKEKVIRYCARVINIRSRDQLASIRHELPFDKFSMTADTALLELIVKCKVTKTPGLERFYQIPILSSNFSNCKRLGEIILNDRSSTGNRSITTRDYERLIEKDPLMLITNYFAGISHFQNRNYEKSSRYLKELLELTPYYSSLKLLLARSYRLAGRGQDALAVVSEYERNSRLSVPFMLEQALTYDDLGSRAQAVALYARILQLDPAQPEALLALAKQRNDEAKPKEALWYANKLVAADSGNGRAYYERARSYRTLAQMKKAYDDIENALSITPADPDILEYAGDLYMQSRQYSKAVTCYEKAVSLNPDKLSLHLKTAKSLESDNRIKDALSLLEKIKAEYGDEPDLQKTLGMLEYTQRRYGDAQNHLEAYVKNGGKEPDAVVTLAAVYDAQGYTDRALLVYNQAIPLLADKNACKLAMARLYLKKLDISSAMKELNDILARRPVKDAYRLMGDAYLAKGNPPTALIHYMKERELHGDDEYVQFTIANIQFTLGHYGVAKMEFNRLTRIAPDNADAYYYAAILALKDKDFAAAQSNLTLAQGFGKGNAAIYQMLADEYMKASQFTEAIPMYNKCLAFEPKREEALLNLATAQVNADKDSAAAETFILIYNINPARYYEYLSKAGHTFLKLNYNRKAENAYTEYLNKGYKDASVTAGLAAAYYSRKEYAKVVPLLKNLGAPYSLDSTVLLQLADSYCRLGRHQEALPVLGKIKVMSPGNIMATELIAVAYDKIGDMSQATRMYREFLKSPRTSRHGNYAFHLGELYEKRGLTDDATAQYAANMKDYPEDMRNYERLAGFYLNGKQFDKAKQILDISASYPEQPPRLQLMQAQANNALGNRDAAVELYKNYLAAVPGDSTANRDLGRIFFEMKKYKAAVAPLARASALMPQNFDCAFMLGASFVETGSCGKAVAPLSRAHSLNPRNTGVMAYAARSYRSLKEITNLMTVLEKWAAVDKKRSDIRVELGSMLLDAQQVQEATTVLNEAVAIDANDESAHRFLARAYASQDKDSLHLFHLNMAFRCGPRNWENNYRLALYYLGKKRPQDAEQYLRTTIELNPSNARAHFEYGYILAQRGETMAAQNEFRLAVNKEPGNALYIALHAFTLSMTGKSMEAIDRITAALSKDQGDLRVAYWAGLVYRKAGNRAVARQVFTDIVTADPANGAALEALGDVELEDAKFSEAAMNYFQSWEKGGYTEAKAMKLSRALMYAGKFGEAKGFLETLIAGNSAHAEALYRLALAYGGLNDLKKMKKTVNMLVNNRSIVYQQLAQGKMYELEKNREAAMIAYRIVMRISPENANAHAGLGNIFLANREYDSAIAHLSKAYEADSLDFQLAMSLGKACEAIGEVQSAIRLYNEVDRKYPGHPSVQMEIAHLGILMNNHGVAINALNRGIKYHPEDTEMYFRLGNEYAVTDQYELAIKTYEKAFKAGKGRNIEALKYIGNIYYSYLVNNKKAREFYRKYVKAGGKSDDVDEAMKKLEGI